MPAKSDRKHVITAAALVPAEPSRVYAVIADYHRGHRHILPKEFSGMVVEKGGTGRGTVIRFQVSVFGRKQTFRAAISEPEPGRVLVETDLDTNGAVTTFVVDPDPASGHSRVTITTELATRKGLAGTVEKFLSTRLLRPMYVRELGLLAAYVGEHPRI
jgi:Polyketide cyclase / dehydrase and lipid transport